MPSTRPGTGSIPYDSKPSRKREEGERGGVPVGSQQVLAIASKVGLGDSGLGTSEEGSDLRLVGRISASHGTTKQWDGNIATATTTSEGGGPEPTKGMVVVRGQEGMAW